MRIWMPSKSLLLSVQTGPHSHEAKRLLLQMRSVLLAKGLVLTMEHATSALSGNRHLRRFQLETWGSETRITTR